MRKVTLKSGKEVELGRAPFKEARALFSAFAEEMRGLKFDPGAEMDIDFIKNLLCTGVYSKKVDDALWPCMIKSNYMGVKIVQGTFDQEGAVEDFLEISYLVAWENVSPFLKNLYAQYESVLKEVKAKLLA